MNDFWDDLKFKLFGEWKFLYWIVGITIASYFIFYGTIAYIVVHFLKKSW